MLLGALRSAQESESHDMAAFLFALTWPSLRVQYTSPLLGPVRRLAAFLKSPVLPSPPLQTHAKHRQLHSNRHTRTYSAYAGSSKEGCCHLFSQLDTPKLIILVAQMWTQADHPPKPPQPAPPS